MANPVILAVDDDAAVLGAVQRDLRSEYGRDYRIVGAASGPAGLEVLDALLARNSAVALFLVDQRMPEMTGVEFIERAAQRFPDAKRVILTAYADTDVAIAAINAAQVDYYLLKPWEPPEERLFPVLSDLLSDWKAGFIPPFEGIRVLGHRWSPITFQVKEFLARNQIPYRFLDLELDPEARRLGEGIPVEQLPMIFFPDGSKLSRPSSMEVAELIGLKVRAELPLYDLIVVGAGPAGLAAGVYGASEGLKTLIVEQEAPGGQAGQSAKIENYLGFPAGLSGADLARRAVTQASRFGAEILTPAAAVGIQRKDPYRIVELADGTKLNCQAVLVATGVQYRKLEAPGVAELTGAGVYYGISNAEAPSFKDAAVILVGGGNSAGQAAMHLSRFARSVSILVRGESLAESMSAYLIDGIDSTPNIEVLPRAGVGGVSGGDRLQSVTVMGSDGEKTQLEADALFIFIGAAPRTDWLPDDLMRDSHGFILTGTECGPRPPGWNRERPPLNLETSIPGIFAAGDVRSGSIKRIASAAGEGAMGVRFVHEYRADL